MNRKEALKLLQGGPPGIKEWNLRRFYEPLPDLSGVCLHRADLTGGDLRTRNHTRIPAESWSAAEFRDFYVGGANLDSANLQGLNLQDADLSGTNLRDVILDDANLCRVDLRTAILRNTSLLGTDITGSIFGYTVVIANLNLVRGLDNVRHESPSVLSLDTLLRFQTEAPEGFLRGCGLRDEEIAYFRSVLGKPIQFYSCFISYGASDEDFASRLHNDFQAAGIRCWKWNHDARTGRSLWGEIDQAIRVHDKLVLVASEASLKSPAVNREIERALQQEDERFKRKQNGEIIDTDVLFPIRVDDYIVGQWQHERKADVTRKVIADARNWVDPKVYKKVLNLLLRDLKAGVS